MPSQSTPALRAADANIQDHGTGPVPSSPPTPTQRKRSATERRAINYPKKRVPVACDICRARKTRCDAARPACSFCAQLGVECVYRRAEIYHPRTDDKAEENSRAPRAAGEHEIISRLSQIEALLRQMPRLVAPPELPSAHRGAETESVFSPGADFSPRSHHSSLAVSVAPQPTISTKPLIGFDMTGLSHLSGHSCPEPLLPLCEDDFEQQLELQLIQGEGFFQSQTTEMLSLDLAPRRCWQLQQVFAREVLPWCPIMDQQTSSAIVTRASENNFEDEGGINGPWTAIAFLILALGCLTRDNQHKADNPAGIPGISYFRAGCRILDADRTNNNTIEYVQAHILVGFYFLICLRPLQAFEAIRRASDKVVLLLQLRGRLNADSVYREMCHRAYWACYLIEHELQAYVSYSSRLVQDMHEDVPLPLSDYDEPGIYWFLSEIALRRIFSRPRQGVGWNQLYTLYEPVVVDEIALQMAEWHAHLPDPVKFPIASAYSPPVSGAAGMRPLLDPRKAFLRAQFYAVQAILYWPHVVRLLTFPFPPPTPGDTTASREHFRVRDAAGKALNYATIHIFAVEPLLQDRHLMLLADITGLYTITHLLLCTVGVPDLQDIQHPQNHDAIRLSWRCLKIWEANPSMKLKIEKLERLMASKGIPKELVEERPMSDCYFASRMSVSCWTTCPRSCT